MNMFDETVRMIPDSNTRMAVITVADDCYLAHTWFRAAGVECTAADILTFARMIQERRVSGEYAS